MGEIQKAALNVDEAAIFTGLSRNYIYKLIHLNRIPHFKPFGRKGRVYFRAEDLQSWIFRNFQGVECKEAANA